MKLTFSRECRMLFFWYNVLSAVNETHEPVKSFCWRALARQQPILYNIEKSQNLSGVRSETCMRGRMGLFLYPGIPGCLWMHVEISIDFEKKFRSARNQGHDTRGEIWMSVITCGSVHRGHEWFGDDSRSRKTKDFLCAWLLYYVSNFADSRMEVPRYRSSPTS